MFHFAVFHGNSWSRCLRDACASLQSELRKNAKNEQHRMSMQSKAKQHCPRASLANWPTPGNDTKLLSMWYSMNQSLYRCSAILARHLSHSTILRFFEDSALDFLFFFLIFTPNFSE